jgi:hypothetical protein
MDTGLWPSILRQEHGLMRGGHSQTMDFSGFTTALIWVEAQAGNNQM